jgi:hypothetical protein
MGTLNDRPIHNTSFAGFPRVELVYQDDDYARERGIVTTRNRDDGCLPMTDEELAEERALTWVLLKKFTQSIVSFDFTSFSFPVGYSEQRSFLERTADLFTFLADDYCDQAYQSSVPETRLTLLATGIIAGFHVYMQSKKPWNPVLGETLVSRWPNGVVMYAEQSSHHPPMSDVQIYGPDNSWKCSAHCNFTITSGLTKVDIIQRGQFSLEFEDGWSYEWEFPVISVFGIVQGERIITIDGPLVVKDTFNELTLTVDIGPKPDKSKGILKPRHCLLYGGVLDANGKNFVSTLTGDYVKKIEVDGTEVWNLETNKAHRPIAPVEDKELLPSDSRYRLDRALLIQGDLPKADEIKVTIEEAQRREKKVRHGTP